MVSRALRAILKLMVIKHEHMHQLVRYLYPTESNSARVKDFVASKEEALNIAQMLIANKGWRERVTAARIITAYQLQDLVPALISTFENGPEYYTCRAFSKMISEVLGREGLAYFEKMKTSCPKTEYGENMIRIINKELDKVNLVS